MTISVYFTLGFFVLFVLGIVLYWTVEAMVALLKYLLASDSEYAPELGIKNPLVKVLDKIKIMMGEPQCLGDTLSKMFGIAMVLDALTLLFLWQPLPTVILLALATSVYGVRMLAKRLYKGMHEKRKQLDDHEERISDLEKGDE